MVGHEAIVRLSGVAKSFGDQTVLEPLCLDVKNGEFLTILGPSGCGKTTILRLIAGFETPSSGDVFIAGQRANDTPPNRRRVNTVFQSYALFPHMSVAENVAFGLQMSRAPKAEIAARVADALRMVGLENLAARRPRQLSGGQQQRVAIARAVVNQPLVLLLDEPLSALDVQLRMQMRSELKHLQRKLGITFIFVTHDQEEAFAMSDRVVVMSEGRIEQTGAPAEVYEEPVNLYVARFVGETNILDGRILARENGHVAAVVEGTACALAAKRPFAPGDLVKVILRPEDLWLERTPPSGARQLWLPGAVEETVYKGATYDIAVNLDIGKRVVATEFFNEDADKIAFAVGERVHVSWIQGWEVVLPDGG